MSEMRNKNNENDQNCTIQNRKYSRPFCRESKSKQKSNPVDKCRS